MTFRYFLVSVIALVTAVALPAAELNVFAAASLSDALKEIGRKYEEVSGDKVRFNLGASSLLARQIKEGAPADVFFSADEAKMADLAGAGLIQSESRRTLLSNTLVIVVTTDRAASVESVSDLATSGVRRLALAETQTVPAGIYAREYLSRIGLWEKLSGKIVPMENVRATLAAVESGNADAGIVYKTDALISKSVKIALEIPASEGPKIAYPVAVIRTSKRLEAAQRFTTYLESSDASAVFAKFGFLPAR